MFDLEERILKSINMQRVLFGLKPGTLILQKVGRKWKPGIIIGSKEQDGDIQLWTAEEERSREVKYICWGMVQRPLIKIVKNSVVKELTIGDLVRSLREFSQEANKIGIKNILSKANDIYVSQ